MSRTISYLTYCLCFGVAGVVTCCGAAAKQAAKEAASNAATANGTGSSASPGASPNGASPSPPSPTSSTPSTPVPGSPAPVGAFALTINPIIVASCGTSSCHGVGSAQDVYENNSSEFIDDGPVIVPATNGSYAGTALAMPPPGSSKILSAANQAVLLSYLTANNAAALPSAPASPATPSPPASPSPSPTPSPTSTPVSVCTSVSAADKATGAALTFDQYTTSVTTACGGSGCHSGTGSELDFVGNLAEAEDPDYSEDVISAIENGSMPRGRSLSLSDRDVIFDYLCGHLNI